MPAPQPCGIAYLMATKRGTHKLASCHGTMDRSMVVQKTCCQGMSHTSASHFSRPFVRICNNKLSSLGDDGKRKQTDPPGCLTCSFKGGYQSLACAEPHRPRCAVACNSAAISARYSQYAQITIWYFLAQARVWLGFFCLRSNAVWQKHHSFVASRR